MREESELWRRERAENWSKANAVYDVDSFFFAEGEVALLVAGAVIIQEGDAMGACTGGGWQKTKTESTCAAQCRA